MTPDRAAEIATQVIGPAGLMGYLVGRGSWWPSEARLKEARRAIAHVMADAYELCRPLWRLHPQLDPATNKDPLGLAGRPNSRSDTPDDLVFVLDQMKAAARSALSALVAQFPAEVDQLTASSNAIVESAASAQHLIQEAAQLPKEPAVEQ